MKTIAHLSVHLAGALGPDLACGLDFANPVLRSHLTDTCCPLASDLVKSATSSQITADMLVDQSVPATSLYRCRSLVLTTKFDFPRGSGSLRSHCPIQSRRKTRPHRRLWAEQLAAAEISLAGQPARQGHEYLVGPPRAEIVAVCCEAVVACLQRQQKMPKHRCRVRYSGIIYTLTT